MPVRFSASLTKPTTTNVYKYEHVNYEAGLKLKGEDKYATCMARIGPLFENIQLVGSYSNDACHSKGKHLDAFEIEE